MEQARSRIAEPWKLMLLSISCLTAVSSKPYSGQRVFVDTQIIDFADPAKHGFHVVLNEDFVNTHLQPIRLPTVFATAIALKTQLLRDRYKNGTDSSAPNPPTNAAALNDGLRVTKILYPENIGPEDGLLDGRTIKLLGLQERTWYYVCVEFESNLNRHELATGTSCQLKRTLDKFGKTAESAVSDVELSEVTDRSISVKLKVDIDFPIRLSVFLSQERAGDRAKSAAVQTFVMEHGQILSATFSALDPEVSYGSLCVLEQPLPIPTGSYTAMGRAIFTSMQHCYFDDLKTTPVTLKLDAQERQQLKSAGVAKAPQQGGKRIFGRASATNSRPADTVVGCLSLLIAVLVF